MDPCPVGLRGIVPSLNTPLRDDGTVDTDSLARLVEHVIDTGCSGMLALAVASEAANLPGRERDRIAETVVARADGRLPVILGAIAPDQQGRVAGAARARSLGADAVLAQLPLDATAGARARMLHEIAAAGPPLLMLQDLDWHGPGLPVDEIAALFAAEPRFGCLKVEVVPAGPKYAAVLAATEGRLHVSGGWAVGQMLDALARGVHAFMGTELETVYVAIRKLHGSGDRDGARALFEAALPVLAFANQHIDVSIRFLKMLRHANGIFSTDRCTPAIPGFDVVQAAEARRLIPQAQALIARAERILRETENTSTRRD